MKIKHYISGTNYLTTIGEFPFNKKELEDCLNSLRPEENTCISYNKKRVYNSFMAPLYSNGEICLAWKTVSGNLVKNFEFIGK